MRVLCPSCGFHHEVVRVLEQDGGDVYEVAPHEACTRAWLTDRDVLEARARFGADAIVRDDEG